MCLSHWRRHRLRTSSRRAVRGPPVHVGRPGLAPQAAPQPGHQPASSVQGGVQRLRGGVCGLHRVGAVLHERLVEDDEGLAQQEPPGEQHVREQYILLRTLLGSVARIALWHLRFSHFNEKGRWALDYKGHRAPSPRASVPGRHPLRSRRLGGRGTTPLLQIDGETIGDSTEIVARLEQRNPSKPLYFDTEIERNAALELEDHFDEELGPQIFRSAVFAALLSDKKMTSRPTMQGLPSRERVVASALWPVLRPGLRRSLPADVAAGQSGREATVAALDLIESELHGEYLVGERFSVADLTAAALLFPLIAPPEFPYELPARWPEEWEEFRSSLAGRPGFQVGSGDVLPPSRELGGTGRRLMLTSPRCRTHPCAGRRSHR